MSDIKHISDLLFELDKIEIPNKSGSLARRFFFLNQQASPVNNHGEYLEMTTLNHNRG
jgi:hypothetical protein